MNDSQWLQIVLILGEVAITGVLYGIRADLKRIEEVLSTRIDGIEKRLETLETKRT